jgi:hypothetical protein
MGNVPGIEAVLRIYLAPNINLCFRKSLSESKTGQELRALCATLLREERQEARQAEEASKKLAQGAHNLSPDSKKEQDLCARFLKAETKVNHVCHVETNLNFFVTVNSSTAS